MPLRRDGVPDTASSHCSIGSRQDSRHVALDMVASAPCSAMSVLGLGSILRRDLRSRRLRAPPQSFSSILKHLLPDAISLGIADLVADDLVRLAHGRQLAADATKLRQLTKG